MADWLLVLGILVCFALVYWIGFDNGRVVAHWEQECEEFGCHDDGADT